MIMYDKTKKSAISRNPWNSKPSFLEESFSFNQYLEKLYRAHMFDPKKHSETEKLYKRRMKYKKKQFFPKKKSEIYSVGESNKNQLRDILRLKNCIETLTQILFSDCQSLFEILYHIPDPNIVPVTENTNTGNHDYYLSNRKCP